MAKLFGDGSPSGGAGGARPLAADDPALAQPAQFAPSPAGQLAPHERRDVPLHVRDDRVADAFPPPWYGADELQRL